jgi:hypothetical protein
LPKHISRFGFILAVVAALVTGSALAPAKAHAQDPMEPTAEQVDASPKGLIGLGLIGAELGLTIPALAGLDETWSLIVFPAVGFAGGAVAGHYLIDQNDKEKVAVAMLMTGLALVIPSIVITVAATAYDPEEAFEDEEDIDEASPGMEEEAEASAPTQAETHRQVARAGSGMVRVHEGGVALTLPGLSVGNVYTPDELARFGGEQATEVQLSIVSGVF